MLLCYFCHAELACNFNYLRQKSWTKGNYSGSFRFGSFFMCNSVGLIVRDQLAQFTKLVVTGRAPCWFPEPIPAAQTATQGVQQRLEAALLSGLWLSSPRAPVGLSYSASSVATQTSPASLGRRMGQAPPSSQRSGILPRNQRTSERVQSVMQMARHRRVDGQVRPGTLVQVPEVSRSGS